MTDNRNFYPDMPPMLEGENADQYTDRLTGADKTNRVPYNHRRFRGCSIGWHEDCSDPRGYECQCPCHQDNSDPEYVWVDVDGIEIEIPYTLWLELVERYGEKIE